MFYGGNFMHLCETDELTIWLRIREEKKNVAMLNNTSFTCCQEGIMSMTTRRTTKNNGRILSFFSYDDRDDIQFYVDVEM